MGREENEDQQVEYGSVGISKGLTLAVRQKQDFSENSIVRTVEMFFYSRLRLNARMRVSKANI